MQQPDRLKSDTLSRLASWCPVGLSLVTFLCGDQSLHLWCLLSASRLPRYLAFLVLLEAPFTPVYYADQFHRLVSSVLSTEKLAEDSEFLPLSSLCKCKMKFPVKDYAALFVSRQQQP